MGEPVRRVDAVCRRADALCARRRLAMDAGIRGLCPWGTVDARSCLDAPRGRARAGRYLLCRRFRAHQGEDRLDRRGLSAAALRDRADGIVTALCGAVLEYPRALARNQRAADRLFAEDADPALRVVVGDAGGFAGDPGRRGIV